MVTSGSKASNQASIEEVAQRTVDCLKANVPESLPGITFLSGGQSDVDATAHLDAMNKIGGFNWKLSFSYGRALQQPALKAWMGQSENGSLAQEALSHRALMNKLASEGKWDQSLEINLIEITCTKSFQSFCRSRGRSNWFDWTRSLSIRML